MKANIHPKWYPNCKVTCACGNTFTVGSTVPEINVEICSACHPFFTGQMKFIDSAGRVEAFKAKQKAATKVKLSKSEKRKAKRAKKIAEEMARPETLEEVRKQVKKNSK